MNKNERMKEKKRKEKRKKKNKKEKKTKEGKEARRNKGKKKTLDHCLAPTCQLVTSLGYRATPNH
jgi:hypothetical protein